MIYDLLMLGVLIFAAARGAAKGIVWQLATIAALVLCFAFSESLSLAVAPLITVKPPLNRWIAMFGLYLGFSFVSFAAARSLREWIEKAKFVEYDRHLGGLFGLVKGGVFCLFVTFFTVTLSESARAYIFNSYSGYAAAVAMDQLHVVMPDGLHDVLEPYIHQLDRPGLNRHVADGHDHDHDDHDGHDHRRPSSPDLSVPAPIPHAPQPAPSRPSDAPQPFEPDELVRRIPALLNTELRQLALRALQQATPEQRSDLLSRLGTALPDEIRRISLEWTSGPSSATGDQTRPERERLLREIAAVYSDFAGAQETLIEELELSLAGLPDQVALAAVRDWHSDLLAFDRAADPDPETDLSTLLDERIVRQLDRARVPLTALPGELQRRLGGTARW